MIYFDLFITFFLIGLFTFGGGYAMIPMIKEQIVAKGWLTENQLLDFIAVSESTPGPFAINIATFVGTQTAPINWLGAICSTLGVVLPSFIIILLIAILFNKLSKNNNFKKIINGTIPVVIGLIISTSIIMMKKIIIVNDSSINTLSINKDSLTLLVIISSLLYIIKRFTKKDLSPFKILGLCALFGLIIF